MAIELYWDDDARTTMLMEIEGAWTWDEMYETAQKIKKVTDNATHEIAAILDVSRGATVPGGSIFNPQTLQHGRNMLKMGEGGTGPLIIVGANSFIRTIYNALYRLDKKALSHVQFADTVEAARALLAAQRKQVV